MGSGPGASNSDLTTRQGGRERSVSGVSRLVRTSQVDHEQKGEVDETTLCAGGHRLRLDTGTGCLPSERAVQWNHVGPQGPPGNTDVTVRHFSQFILTGRTVTAPVVAATGERGKLSIFCGDDPSGSGGVGNISFATDNTSSINEAVTFVSPQIPTSSWQQLPAGGTATFPWNAPKNDNVSFEMMIEPMGSGLTPVTTNDGKTPEDPERLDIRGFVQQFSFGCAFYVYMDASEVPAPMTITP
jgi:hypothetical protein